ncbi:MAG: hypothetical protein HY361_05290 [Candidatus Aenigmarchaeota archaeon]|nr:hypothetical protein [Candidatus Aenigmarchaeota archaeon]
MFSSIMGTVRSRVGFGTATIGVIVALAGDGIVIFVSGGVGVAVFVAVGISTLLVVIDGCWEIHPERKTANTMNDRNANSFMINI